MIHILCNTIQHQFHKKRKRILNKKKSKKSSVKSPSKWEKMQFTNVSLGDCHKIITKLEVWDLIFILNCPFSCLIRDHFLYFTKCTHKIDSWIWSKSECWANKKPNNLSKIGVKNLHWEKKKLSQKSCNQLLLLSICLLIFAFIVDELTNTTLSLTVTYMKLIHTPTHPSNILWCSEGHGVISVFTTVKCLPSINKAYYCSYVILLLMHPHKKIEPTMTL